jgi:energy-coupling factor transporter ATP-binding protein EcfA2
MQVKIHDVGGIVEAEFEIQGITLIAGKNFAGKSTIARSVASLLSGVVLPLPGCKKGSALELVRDGKKLGILSLHTANGDARLSYPKCEMVTEGMPPTASRIAAGIDDLFQMDVKERSALLQKLLRTKPTPEELATKLKEFGANEATIAALQKSIDRLGWDATAADCATTATKKKGAWEQVTRKRWGSEAGASWVPETADVSITIENRDRLLDAFTRTKTALEAAIGTAAMSEAEREALQAHADALEERQKILADLEDQSTAKAVEMVAAQNHRRGLPPANVTAGIPCPECSTPLIIRDDHVSKTFVLEKAAPVSDADLKQRCLDIAGADGSVLRLQNEHAALRQKVLEASSELKKSEDAVKTLAAASGKGGSADAVPAARQAHQEAADRLAEYDRWVQAKAIHDDIVWNLQLAGLLGDAGLRKTKLEEVLSLFNEPALKELSETAGWSTVVIHPDLSITYGDRRYELLSKSEQWRARAVLQVAIARIERADLIVLDEADILDRRGRNGLVAMLSLTKIPALVAMTITKPDKAPDMSRAGGMSYWVEAGVVSPLSAVLQQVAA